MRALLARAVGPVRRERRDQGQRQDQFRILFEYSRDAHLIFDESGIIDCNEAAVAMLDLGCKENVIGLHPAVLSPERQPDGRLSSEKSVEMDGLAQANGYHRFDWMHCRPDGTPIPVEVTLTRVDFHGREALLTVWHDLSERVERERELEAARDAAEHAMRARSRFLATMSHEMRTPLNGVIATSQLLAEQDVDEDGLELCKIIQDSADHLLFLIDDILDFSKIDAGQMELQTEPVSMRETAKRLVDLLRARAAEQGLQIAWHVHEDVPAFVLADGPRLDQILLNLLSNAVKFTARGAVTLSVDMGEDDTVRCAVRDTGIGIPADQVESIFDPFSQVEDSSTRRFGGTGLGLSISKDLARLMGGDLACTSTIGAGSCFTLEAPLRACAAPEISRAESDQRTFEGLRVLVAEDNPVNQRVLGILLAKLGCEVTFARNGREAIDACARSDFDVILMDLHMPVLDGVDATRELCAAGVRTPILALTASTLEEDRDASLAAGMVEVLEKPVRMAGLRAALARWGTGFARSA